jgi:hypothetical protein
MVEQKELYDYLSQFGWTPSRRVQLPDYIDAVSTPDIVVRIISNLYGLEIRSRSGRRRTFTVPRAYIDDFEEDQQEWIEDTRLLFQFYPLGVMSEFGGILVLDAYGRFYLMGDELIYYGDDFLQFANVQLFSERTGLSIREGGKTFYIFNDKNTGYLFDVDKGWLGPQEYLDASYIMSTLKQ